MDYSGTFARHFARLVFLLMHEFENRDEQKMALRAVVAVNKEGPVTLVSVAGDLVANGETVAAPLTGVREMVERMADHGLREIHFDSTCRAADVLSVARIMATDFGLSDGGRQARSEIDSIGTVTIRFVPVVQSAPVMSEVREPEAVLHAEHAADAPLGLEPTQHTEPQPEGVTAAAVSEPAPIPEPVSEPHAPPSLRQTTGPEPAAARRNTPLRNSIPGLLSDGTSSMYTQFSPAPIKDTPEALGTRLAAAVDATDATRVLDDIVTVAENSAREGKPAVVGDLFHGIVVCERVVSDPDVKRSYVMAVRRMSKPTLLRAVATLAARNAERRSQYLDVLVRTGQDGADAVIEQLTQAQTAEDRRILFEILTQLKSAVPALVHMLGDARWFVTRNAADLLGELQAADAEGALAALLHHCDERVRRSATNALIRLGTETGLRVIYDAIRDPAPQVRMQAAAAVASRRDPQTAATLIRAIDDEQDTDVQLAILAALGKMGTKDAVERLIRAAEPERGLFRKRSIASRVAAIQALGESRTPAAIAALKALAGDKDKEIRDTVARVSQQLVRG
jgi:HEAT repeat protein